MVKPQSCCRAAYVFGSMVRLQLGWASPHLMASILADKTGFRNQAGSFVMSWFPTIVADDFSIFLSLGGRFIYFRCSSRSSIGARILLVLLPVLRGILFVLPLALVILVLLVINLLLLLSFA